MPELPEVETVRRDIDARFRGRRIQEAEATGVRTLRRHGSPGELVDRVQNRELIGARRRGKYLLLDLDSGDVVVVHLGMSGQLLAAAASDPPIRHTHVALHFDGGDELRFVDPRTFGEVFVSTPEGPAGEIAELAHLGLDPLDAGEDALAGALAGRTTKLKPLLMDQRRIAGIGNMYADEILFAAQLRFDRAAASLNPREIGALHRSMVDVLTEAIAHRGSSLADEQYRDLYGQVGRYQLRHRVYARQGQPCPRCATPVARLKVAGRSNFFCPKCQA